MRPIEITSHGVMMTLTTHEQTELGRCAQAFYAAGDTATGHRLSGVAARIRVPAVEFDRAMKTYRSWLIG